MTFNSQHLCDSDTVHHHKQSFTAANISSYQIKLPVENRYIPHFRHEIALVSLEPHDFICCSVFNSEVILTSNFNTSRQRGVE